MGLERKDDERRSESRLEGGLAAPGSVDRGRGVKKH